MADLPHDINTEFLHLAGALMEHFLEEIAPLNIGTLIQMRRVINANILF